MSRFGGEAPDNGQTQKWKCIRQTCVATVLRASSRISASTTLSEQPRSCTCALFPRTQTHSPRHVSQSFVCAPSLFVPHLPACERVTFLHSVRAGAPTSRNITEVLVRASSSSNNSPYLPPTPGSDTRGACFTALRTCSLRRCGDAPSSPERSRAAHRTTNTSCPAPPSCAAPPHPG